MTTTAPPQTALVPESTSSLAKLTKKLARGEHVDLSEILHVIAPVEPGVEVVQPAEPPVPAVIAEYQQKALDRLPEVFGKVQPTKRRALTKAEISQLVEETIVLKPIETLVSDRRDAIRKVVFIHADLDAEAKGLPPDVRMDRHGHYILKGEVVGDADAPNKFSRTTSGPAPDIDAEVLKSLEHDPDFKRFFTHQDYLDMTTATRTVDEHKVMLKLRDKPELIAVLRRATTPDGRWNVLNFPKA